MLFQKHANAPPPMPEKRPSDRWLQGEKLFDPYAWLRDRDDPQIRAHIDEENAYSERHLSPTAPLQRRLCEEMLSRVDLNRVTVPVLHGNYEYYSRNEQDKSYPIHCRRLFATEGPEEVILDENVLAGNNAYFNLGFLTISPDHSRCVFGIDTTAEERLSVFVKNLTGNQTIVGPMPGAAAGAAWAADSQTFFFVLLDARNRPFQLVRHCLAKGSISGEVIFEERDEAFRLQIAKTESGRFLILTSWAHDTTELHYLDANEPTAALRLLHGRQIGVEAYATHHGQAFYIVTNENAPSKKIVMTPVTDPLGSEKRVFLDSRVDVVVSQIQAFAGHLVVWERSDGLSQLRVVDMQTGNAHCVELPDAAYTLHPEDNREFETAIFRFGFDSLTRPYTVYDYDLTNGSLHLRQQCSVQGYDPANYRSERILVAAADGVEVPLSLVYRAGLRKDGNHPALLYGYGAYGYCLEAEFSSVRLSLLDRGFVYAIAHVRGGGELGRQWHDQGKGQLKHNSFRDFIACAERLVHEGYTSPRMLAIMGESAGGLLAAAAINDRPELFKVVVVDGPFVDVVNTLADETLPLTISEWKEWGNPSAAADYAYLRAYSPYENVKRQAYPSILVFCSFNDPRVPYWEGLKWAARIREMSTNDPDILVKVRLDGGHQGVSDRFDEVSEWALIYAFIIDCLSEKQNQIASK
jgi:oligopeptidase B